MDREEQTILTRLKPWAGTILLFPLIIYVINNEGRIFLIDQINLLIHEGGHGIFKPFGKYIYTLGGTITQILIPTMFVVYYLYNRKKILAQIFLVWLGQNFINVSIYVSDARARALPLFGGNKVYHDWTFILGEMNLLEQDILIGKIIYSISLIVFVVSLIIPRIKKRKRIDLNMDL